MAQIEVVISSAFTANINITDDELADEVILDDDCRQYTAQQIRQAVRDFRIKQAAMTTNMPGFAKFIRENKRGDFK